MTILLPQHCVNSSEVFLITPIPAKIPTAFLLFATDIQAKLVGSVISLPGNAKISAMAKGLNADDTVLAVIAQHPVADNAMRVKPPQIFRDNSPHRCVYGLSSSNPSR